MALVVVAQAPSRSSDPALPLSGATGRRLARLAGLPVAELRERAELRNLLDDYPGRRPDGNGDLFPLDEARAAAAVELGRWRAGDRVVLLGRAVAEAFGLWVGFLAPLEQGVLDDPSDPVRIVCVPHPSGANRWYNNRRNRAAASRVLRDFLRGDDEGRE